MHSRRQHAGLLFAFLCLAVGAWACESPLGIDTPRQQYLEGIGDPVAADIGEPVSIVIDTSSGTSAFSAALVFDGSGGVLPPNSEAMKRAGNAFLDSLDGENDEAAVICFNSTVTVFQRMTPDPLALRNAVNALPIVGATAMWDGIYTAVLAVQSQARNTRRAVVVVTETGDNSSGTGTPQRIIALARSANIALYTISLRVSKDESALAELAAQTGGSHHRLPALGDLEDIYRDIAHTLKNL